MGILLAVAFINTGTDIIVPYTSTLLGESEVIDQNIFAISVPIFGIVSAFLVLLLVEPCRRKTLLFISSCWVTIFMIFLMGYFFLMDENVLNCTIMGGGRDKTELNQRICKWIVLWPVVSLALLRLGFQLGWGSVLYIIMGEMLPIKIKEFGSGIIQLILNLHAISTLTLFPYISRFVGNGYTFLILVIFNIVSCIMILLFLPETRGLQADEIEEIFQENTLLCGLNRSSNSYSLEKDRL